MITPSEGEERWRKGGGRAFEVWPWMDTVCDFVRTDTEAEDSHSSKHDRGHERQLGSELRPHPELRLGEAGAVRYEEYHANCGGREQEKAPAPEHAVDLCGWGKVRGER